MKRDPSEIYSAANPFMAPLTKAVTLSAPHHLMKVFKHFEFDLTAGIAQGLEYETGDYLGVIPSNLKSVETILDRLELDGNTVIQRESEKGSFKDIPRLPEEFTLREALTHYFDIRTPPKRFVIKVLAEHAHNPFERRTLFHLAGSSEDSAEFYRTFVVRDNRGIGSLVRDFPSIRLSPEALLSKLGPLRARYYSIANAAEGNSARMASICMGMLHAPAPDGRPWQGVNSLYMSRAAVGDQVPIFIQKSSIRLPDIRSHPVILVGIGSGVSLLRSFYLDRCATSRPSGPTLLFYGCNGETDHLYKEEMESLRERGLETFHSYTFDREYPTFVQFQFQQQGRRICDLMTMENAHLYICGSPVLRTAIRSVLASVFRRHAGMSFTESTEYIDFLYNTGKLVEEVFT